MAEDDLGAGMDADPHEDYWDEMPRERPDRTTIALVAGAVAVLIIITILVVVRGSGDDTTTAEVTQPSTAVDGGSTSATTPAATWQGGINFEPPGFPGGDHVPLPGTKPGVYIWVSFDGWFVRLVKGDGIGDVRVTAEANDLATVKKVSEIAPEAVRADGKVIFMDLRTFGATAGVDFDFGFYTNKVQFTVDGPDGRIPVDKIYYGTTVQPSSFNPATFEKR